jgi:hypothetical protein
VRKFWFADSTVPSSAEFDDGLRPAKGIELSLCVSTDLAAKHE